MNHRAKSWASNHNFFFNSSFIFPIASSMLKHISVKFEGLLWDSKLTLVFVLLCREIAKKKDEKIRQLFIFCAEELVKLVDNNIRNLRYNCQ